MQIAIMEFFQHISSPFLDTLVEIMTMAGEETIFILFISYILWCHSKQRGFALFSSLFTALIGMSFLKAIIRAPRPFQVLEGIEGKRIETATGYSFPSGHTTGAASFYSSCAYAFRKRWLSILCAIVIILVALSRMYLGVHWPIDVFGGLALGITVTSLTYWRFFRLYENTSKVVMFSKIVGIVSAIGTILFAFLIEGGIADPIGFTDPLKLLALAAGGYIGFSWEHTAISYSTKGSLLVKILRFLVGVVILLAIQSSKALLPEHAIFSSLRYALVGLWATALYPAIGVHIRFGTSKRLFQKI